MIPYGRQSINEDDIDAVVQVLQNDFITQGPMVPAFEKSVTDFCGAKFGVAVSSGTAGLHIALKALGVGHGDIVWTSPISFVASANAARYCGAKVDFIDIEPKNANICIHALEKKCIEAEENGQLPKVVVPVHFAGQSCDMKAVANLAKRFGFLILEDAAHALGGEFEGVKIGSCKYSDAVVHSFHPVKIITTGEGGMVTTNHQETADRLERLRTHGITRAPEAMQNESHGPWYYEQLELGYHYRMTDLQAALGKSQMKRLPEFVRQRRELAKRYQQSFGGQSNFDFLVQNPAGISGWHLFVVVLKEGIDRRAVFEAMRERGIGVNVHYIPIHLQPDFKNLGFTEGQFPNSENFYRSCLTLPLHPSLTQDDQDKVISALIEVTK